MRVLFSTTAGTGHFGPLIPVARVCQAAGHTVAVAATARFAEAVTGAAFDHLPFADPSPELRGKVFNRAPQLTFEEMNRLVLAEVFARLDAQAALPTLSEIMIDWRPDLVVREPCEFGSLVAAESVGIPQLQVAIMTGRIGPGILGVVRESLAELSTMAGLLPERAAGVLLQADSLTSVPEALDSGDLRLGGAEAEEAVSDRGRMWRFRTDTPVKPRLPATWVAAVADIPAALRRVLGEPAFAEGARAMAAEIAALPDIAECLPLLEQLASSRVSADD